MHKILIIEDEANISMVLKVYLEKQGYVVEQAYDGDQALDMFAKGKPSLVLLDVMLPGIDGWSILKHIRERSACPVMMLTALGDIQYRLEGLTGGADDYLVKPFIGAEVVARVQAVLRRIPQVWSEEVVIFGNLRIDYTAREVLLSGQRVHLTPRDLALLLFLASHPNQLFDREHLIQCVWGIEYEGSDRAVDLAVKRIRKSLAAWSSEEGELETLRGMGYKFRAKACSS
ncbi:Transcriptional regulatory protein SrrA [Paenibacillus plantiphilus]|uniref:Transcriptional regulatory protein SrrA n=1 Tax=Paenibacillus plantiphilus TaxID=2905650 RepID=A0ABN8GUN1_9BACL|nr:response regulator transcription factor [Paenibacillus plantiphilus]CAH1216249.1 Transcriptional regulatory protein SrrA [Paenibacillus plantiphilus]